MQIFSEAKILSLESKFSNLIRKLWILSPLKQYSLALQFFRDLLVCYTSRDVVDDSEFFLKCFNSYIISFFSQQTSFSIKTRFLNAVRSIESLNISFEPCALNSLCCEIPILRYNFKCHVCYTFSNSHSKSPGCSNQRDSTVFS